MAAVESSAAPMGITSRVRPAFAALASGVLAGLINAVVARILMRIVALIINGRGGFSIGGTLNIVMFGVLLGSMFGAAYGLLHDRLPGKPLIKGALFALIMVFVFQIPVLMLVAEFRTEVMANGGLGLAVFGLINLIYSLTLAAIYPQIRQRVISTNAPNLAMTISTIVLGLIAVVGFAVILYETVGRAFGFIEPFQP
jgi:hypothetical protein